MKVFLGGTCNDSDWRDELIKRFDKNVEYFNPVVEDWTEECYQEELKQRSECDICLYVITSDMTGVYSIAEVIDDSNKRPIKTVFAFLKEGFDKHQIKSLDKVGQMVLANGGYFINETILNINRSKTIQLNKIAKYLNNISTIKKY